MNMNIAQTNMVKQQLRTGNVVDNSILGLYQALPRESFVPRTYKQFAYSDFKIPLAQQQKMLTPLEESVILQELDLQGNENILQIGTGSGFLTALLAQNSAHVISVDYYKDITEQAESNLKQFNIKNVSLETGDAHRGWMDDAPYDVIVMTGAVETLDEIFKPQIMKSGKMFAIVGTYPVMKGSIFSLDQDEQWQEKILFDTCVEPLLTNHTKSTFNF